MLIDFISNANIPLGFKISPCDFDFALPVCIIITSEKFFIEDKTVIIRRN